MAPNNKASVDNSTTIRAASRNKQRSQQSFNRSAAASPFGSSAGGSLASSLSSLFSPQPHGKDAALASLLASSSKPPVKLGHGSGLAAFGSFPGTQPSTSKSIDDKLKDKRSDRKDASKRSAADDAAAQPTKADAAVVKSAAASSSKDSAKTPPSSKNQPHKSTPGTSTDTAAKEAVLKSKPLVPNVPAGRRPVFRPVLASSTAVSWPDMPVAGSKTVLHTLLETLAEPSIKETLYRDLGRRSANRASKKKAKDPEVVMQIDGEPQASSSSPTSSVSPSFSSAAAPVQILAGINSITRAIESDIALDLAKLQTANADASHANQKKKGKANAPTAPAPPSIKVVFVCRHDVSQPSLIAHLPMLVTARNAVLNAVNQPTDAEGVLLFALPSGSESLLAQTLSLKRSSIIALTSAFSPSHLSRILTAIERETGSICQLRANWLESALLAAKTSSSSQPSSSTSNHKIALPAKPPTIILLRTTQPLDINACKLAKKSKRKERSANWKKKKSRLQQKVLAIKAQLKHLKKSQSTLARKKTKHATAKAKIQPSSNMNASSS